MAIDLDRRLQNLRNRRAGFSPMAKATALDSARRLTESVQRVPVLKEEAYERRAPGRATKYTLGAMQAVDPDYTLNTYEEGNRVLHQLQAGLDGKISVEFEYQGSVPLDIHIKGVSDIDMLVLRNDFYTYDSAGPRARSGYYNNPIPDTPAVRMRVLRTQCETILESAYPAADVDITGSKSITLSGGSLSRKVDVVPSHWHNTSAYQTLEQKTDRAVRIFTKPKNEVIENLPFLHMKKITDKDILTWGGTKKSIRLLKTLKADSDYATFITLSSYDVASLVWHCPDTALQVTAAGELALLTSMRDLLGYFVGNKTHVMSLQTPDGTRKIIENEDKFRGLMLLTHEVNQLVEEVGIALGGNRLILDDLIRVVRKAYVAA